MKPRDSKAKNKSSNPGSRRCPTFSFSCLQAFDMSCIRVVGTHPIYKLMTKRHEPPWTEGGEKGEQQQLNGYMSVCNVKSIPENHSAFTPPTEVAPDQEFQMARGGEHGYKYRQGGGSYLPRATLLTVTWVGVQFKTGTHLPFNKPHQIFSDFCEHVSSKGLAALRSAQHLC